MKKIICTVVLVAIACSLWGAGSPERSELLDAWEDMDWEQAGWEGVDWTRITPARVRRNIRRGAEMNAVDDRFGLTAFMYAAGFAENHRIITTMIDADANLSANDAGITPLMVAASYNNNPQVTEALISAGADVDAVDAVYGYTPLVFAVLNNDNPEVLHVLIDAGTNLNNAFAGEIALEMADQAGKREFITILEQAGAQRVDLTMVYRPPRIDPNDLGAYEGLYLSALAPYRGVYTGLIGNNWEYPDPLPEFGFWEFAGSRNNFSNPIRYYYSEAADVTVKTVEERGFDDRYFDQDIIIEARKGIQFDF